MNKKGVIFDLDGTLINSIPAHLEIHQAVCNELGFRLTKSFFEIHCNGEQETDFYKVILKYYQGHLKNYNNALRLSKKYHNKMQLKKIKIFSGVKSTLKKLKKEGFKIAVASSSIEKYIHIILKANNVIHYFDEFVGGDDVIQTKPAPDIFLLARKKLGLPKKACVVIEDANKGVIAAKRAGIDCICLLTSEKRKNIPPYATIVKKHTLLFSTISRMK